jgi:PKD repeat protein
MEGVTYPASNGPVDTIQWEGQREAVDDVKIADKLISVTNRTFTLSTIQAGFTAGQDMRQIRETMIDLILTAQPQAPIASFTANSTYGPTPLPVQFNDTSTNAPTSWTYGAKNQTPGNNSWFTLSSIKDPLVTFGVGNWSINLTAGNAYGANLSSSMWINVTEVSPTPTPTPTATPTTTATTAIPTTTTTTTVPTTAGNTTSKNPYDLPILGPGLFVVGLLVMFFGTCYLWMEKKGK